MHQRMSDHAAVYGLLIIGAFVAAFIGLSLTVGPRLTTLVALGLIGLPVVAIRTAAWLVSRNSYNKD